jgi:hypothetical protein
VVSGITRFDSDSPTRHQPQLRRDAAPGDTWISLSGTGKMVDDSTKVKELWNSWVEAWFPEGPDDPNVVLIKFSSDSAEYWDTPCGRVATVISLLKTKVSGESYNSGQNAKVEL